MFFKKTKLANSKNGGGILTRNAFTLIELLAIIVILAIIAVITVPIILNIIENSKRGAATDSVYGFKDSINKYYLGMLSEDPSYDELDGDYTINSDGYLVSDGVVKHQIQMSGQKPSGGTLTIENEIITNACIEIGDYNVSITNGNVGQAEKGSCVEEGDEINLIPAPTPDPNYPNEVLDNIAGFYPNDIDRVVYYNPIDGIMNCTDYVANNSIPGYKGVVPSNNTLGQTSCLKWYKYSVNNDGTINMILDHNTEVGKQYYTSTVNGYPSSDNSYGPAELMQYLTLSDWGGVPTRSDKYVAYVDNGTTKTVKFTNATETENSVDYSGKKARLITAQEVAEITGASSTTSPGISWNEQNTSSSSFYLDSKNQLTSASSDNPSDYYWLFENLINCEQYGCINQYPESKVDDPRGLGNSVYWTSSPVVSTSQNAWVIARGELSSITTKQDYYIAGLRPVITVSNS